MTAAPFVFSGARGVAALEGQLDGEHQPAARVILGLHPAAMQAHGSLGDG